jgi:hypothetical protein
MGKSRSYEVMSFREGNWTIQAVYDDRATAVFEARRLLGGRHEKGVKIIEETYDDETNETKARIVFNEEKGAEKRPEAPKQESKAGVAPADVPRKKTADDSDFIGYIVKMVLIVGGICLVLLGAVAFLISNFGDGG